MKLIVGLGNPGKEYADTRHNIGFRAADFLRRQLETDEWKFEKKYSADLSWNHEKKIALMKPQTFMNLSGKAVASFASFYKLAPTGILVIYDDVDLPFGTVRFREKGSSGGHRGIESIIDSLGSSDFPRIKIGINQENRQMPTEAFVLQKLSDAEEASLDSLLTISQAKVTDWLQAPSA